MKPLNIICIFISILTIAISATAQNISSEISIDAGLTTETPSLSDESHSETSDTRQAGIRVLILPEVESILSGEISARIKTMSTDMGDRFAAGKNLVVFDCEMYRAQLEKAKAEMEEAQKTLEVNKRLDALKSVSELEMAVSVARLSRARAELALRETQVKKCVVKAPFTGRVVRRKANPFEYATPGQPLLEIIGEHIELQLLVPSHWIKRIRTGLQFKVHIDETGKDYTAKVTTLGARVDPVSQTLEIRAKISGKHPELLAGMSGSAYFQ